MSDYRAAKYIGTDPIHLTDGSLIMNGEETDLLSEEAAINSKDFEPVYGKKEKKKAEKKPEFKKTKKKRGK